MRPLRQAVLLRRVLGKLVRTARAGLVRGHGGLCTACPPARRRWQRRRRRRRRGHADDEADCAIDYPVPAVRDPVPEGRRWAFKRPSKAPMRSAWASVMWCVCVVRDFNSGHQLLLPPANWCPICASPDHACTCRDLQSHVLRGKHARRPGEQGELARARLRLRWGCPPPPVQTSRAAVVPCMHAIYICYLFILKKEISGPALS